MSHRTVEFTVAREGAGPARTVRDAVRRRLPPRYETDLWDLRLRARLAEVLRPGMEILDLGAGRRPTIPRDQRPEGVRYVGLDLAVEELELAEPGSYDETVISAAEDRVSVLEGRFDLCISFFALEHVRSTASVLDNAHAYLRPGGLLLAQLSGSRSPFSLANRLLPRRISRALLRRTHGRDPDSVFPAYYDRCTHSQLLELLSGWSEAEVMPLCTGAPYVLFSRPLTAAYIAYEEWVYRTDRRDLSPYYLVIARA